MFFLDKRAESPKKEKEASPERDGNKEPISESPPPPKTPEPQEGETQEIIIVNEYTKELDLNHGRIGKIENLENMQRLERYCTKCIACGLVKLG